MALDHGLRVEDWGASCSTALVGRALVHSLERRGFDEEKDQAVPGHDEAPVAAEAWGGARGCVQRSKVSMMRMGPPQQGQGGS
jgi:hypothetical protein